MKIDIHGIKVSNIDGNVSLECLAQVTIATGEVVRFHAYFLLDPGSGACRPGRLGACIDVQNDPTPCPRLTWACTEETDCLGNSIDVLRRLENSGLIETHFHEIEGEPHCHWDFTGFNKRSPIISDFDQNDVDQLKSAMASVIEGILPVNL